VRRVALALAVVLGAWGSPGAADAAGPGYSMPTVVRYAVDPAEGEVVVTVEVAFTNTTSNPTGGTSSFEAIDLGVQAGASRLAATDGRGALSVALVDRGGVLVASVRPRARIRYNRSASFTLTYHLADGASPEIHVRPDVVKFPAWGFGTSSDVAVELPSGYEARADGDPMVIDTGGPTMRLTSGPIPDPTTWLALVTATRLITYAAPVGASVALASGTVDLQVRAWSGDAAWGERVLTTLQDGLPKLEEAIGLPYPRLGPLVVSEAVGGEGSGAGQPLAAAEMQVAFDSDVFTILHQAAHLWINDDLASDHWLREGLASHEAAMVTLELGAALPYDPAARTSELAASSFALAAWGSAAGVSASQEYGYAASWAFVDRIAMAAGEANLARVLRRVVAGVPSYDPTDPDQPLLLGGRFVPVDTRRFLDQLTEASGVDLGNSFGQVILGPAADAELRQRQVAREDYAALLRSAGDWGAPDPIRNAMVAWRFDQARAAMKVASAWLMQRDALVLKVARAGLTTPVQLRRQFTAVGGGADAQAELRAEAAVVDAYLALSTRAEAPRSPLETIGLWIADDPRVLLAAAGDDFGRGNLKGAAELLDAAAIGLDRAVTNGVVRIASAVVLVTVLVLLGSATIQRRGGTHYTGVA
jgi:hypothetical protein